jgi:hypothetical protein
MVICKRVLSAALDLPDLSPLREMLAREPGLRGNRRAGGLRGSRRICWRIQGSAVTY